MAENRRGRDNRFYFSRGQMVLLGSAFTGASLIIFFLGIFIGQDIEERKLVKREEPLVKIPVKSAPALSGAPAPTGRDEIVVNERPAAAPNRGAAQEEKAKDSKNAAKPPAAPAKTVENKTANAAPDEKAAKPGPTKASGEAAEASPGWHVQVDAFPDERSAKLLVDRLKNKGYNPFVTEVKNRGKMWYRVNVGKYGTRAEAVKVAEAVKTQESRPNAFVASN